MATAVKSLPLPSCLSFQLLEVFAVLRNENKISLALLLEGRQWSTRATRSSVRLCQPGRNFTSQGAERALPLGLVAVKGRGAASSHVHDVWMIPACPSFSTGGISAFHAIWFSTQHLMITGKYPSNAVLSSFQTSTSRWAGWQFSKLFFWESYLPNIFQITLNFYF